jgi:uncharacterized protein (DUF4213/DUF364 family)
MERMSSLAEEVLNGARRIAGALRPPPISRVFLPTELGPEHHASFCAVQLADGSTGLCYAMLGDTAERLRALAPSRWVGGEALALAEGFAGADAAARSVGLAAVNALTRHLLDRAGFQPDFATSSLGSLPLGPGDRLGMVGYFPPLVRRAREAGIPLTVVELRSDLVQEAHGLTVTLDPARLADCSKIVCTSTTLLNASLDALLAHGRGAREFVIIGPSAGCVPDPLFARGVTGLGGAWVSDASTLLARAERGERWGDATRKFSLRREDWPGLDALLVRAARATPSP